MGGHLTVGASPESANLRAGSEAHGLTSQQRESFQAMLNEAHFNSSAPPNIVMPWEMPAMSLVFGGPEMPLIPPVRPVPLYVEPTPSSTAQPAVLPSEAKATAFEHAISFESRRSCHLPEHEQFALLVQKWEALISINYKAFDLGIDIEHLEYQERLGIISEVLGGKAVATVKQRLGQLGRYVQWSTADAKRPAFPVTPELIKNYVRHLRNQDATHSNYTGFHEALKFAKFVMGLQCDLSAFGAAWVAGIMRTESQMRPLRKQSKVLTVEALQFLERQMEDKQIPSVDRYAIGVILFATYSRARFGDLRGISEIFVDASAIGTSEGVGYLEMHSASHKMRATGNRLGAHLPLVAPLKGLGPHAWGKTFVGLSQQVGLDFSAWCQVQPLLPAPNLMGAWTDRPVTSGEIGRWIRQLLIPCPFDSLGFTPHGCKATTLAMLSKYGVASEVRLALGHHQIQKGAAEVYARDAQSAPLRVLETMFKDIRNGRFHPDQTRSGMFLPPSEQQDGHGQADEVTDLPLPSFSIDQVSPTSMGEVAPVVAVDDETQSQEQTDQPEVQVWPLQVSEEGGVTSDSDTSTDSDADSCATEVLCEQASTQTTVHKDESKHKFYQHRKTKVVHLASPLGTSFLCGRRVTAEYRPYPDCLIVNSMKCQQCRIKTDSKPVDPNLESMDAVVKRARRQ